MKKLKLYIASSLNGKIAGKDGSVDWLESMPTPDNSDYGYSEFYKSIDTTIQGYKTYKQVLDWGIDFPYPDKKNYVFTRKKDVVNTKYVEFVNEYHIEFTRNLKKQNGKDIWLIGGGQINTLLLNAGLIDEIQVFIMPVIIPEGIEIFELIPNEYYLKLIDSKKHSTGAIELKYKLEMQ